MELVFCTQCGSSNDAQGVVCGNCGARLPVFDQPEGGYYAPQPPPPRPYFANDPGGPSYPPAAPYTPPPPSPDPFAYAPPPPPRNYVPPSAYPPPGYQGVDAFGLPSYAAYAPPMSQPQLELADRGTRLGAALIDGLIALPIIGIPMFIGAGLDGSLGHRDGGLGTLFLVLGYLAYFILQAYFLTIQGQSLGKKALGIRIVKKDTGDNGGFVSNVLLRMFVTGIIGAFCGLFSLVDVLFIFGQDQRCIHDHIAGTIVVKNGPDYLKLN